MAKRKKKPKSRQPDELLTDDPCSIAKTWIGAGLLAALVMLASNAPQDWRIWGLDGLSGLDLTTQIVWVASALALAFLFKVLIRACFKTSRISLLVPVIGLSAFLVTILLPASTFLRGDGQLLISTLAKYEIVYERTFFYNALMMTMVRQLGFQPAVAFRIIDSIAALIYILALMKFSSRFSSAPAKAFVMVSGIFTGSLLVLSGLVEYYPLTQAFMMLSLVLAVGAIEKERFPWLGLLAAFIAVGFHFKAVVLLPAFALASRPLLGKRGAIISFAVLSILGFSAALMVARINLLYPLGPMPEDAYTLWSMRHFIDLLNLLVWAAPILLVLAISLGSKIKLQKIDDPVDKFLLAALAGTLAFVLFFSPDLGVARDADLLCLFAIPMTLWFLWRFHHRKIPVNAGLVSAVLFIGLITVGAQVVLQHDEDRTVNRHVKHLKLDPIRSGYGWEVLSVYFRDKGDTGREESILQEAIRHSPNGRYFMRLAQIEIARGSYDKAEPLAREAALKLPDDFHAHGLYGYTLFFQSKMPQAGPALSRAIQLGSTDGNHYSMLANIYLGRDKPEEAKKMLLAGMKQTRKQNEQFHCIFGMVEEALGNSGAAVMHYNRAVQRNPGSPWGRQAAEALKRINE
ncbi:hypothetical protein CEE37_10280 [candidate division LCP-89 bacterium B3_LCP]|uniref:Uncharacterized protein n=1 Tax=candidate division LCP-89 bacterium B3_LCP TaxID=2012998 RepID=A0A532UYS3_UNCL8|nr:MAG: hypothetical protein CEE37_10280 [candidate division LCP-89 bacterium B3_LCP]